MFSGEFSPMALGPCFSVSFTPCQLNMSNFFLSLCVCFLPVVSAVSPLFSQLHGRGLTELSFRSWNLSMWACKLGCPWLLCIGSDLFETSLCLPSYVLWWHLSDTLYEVRDITVIHMQLFDSQKPRKDYKFCFWCLFETQILWRQSILFPKN